LISYKKRKAVGGDYKRALLARIHYIVIALNLLAVGIDSAAGRYANVPIEGIVAALLMLNLRAARLAPYRQYAPYAFLGVTSAALLVLIHLSHFATMAVLFVLLMPLTTILFIRLKHTIAAVALLCLALGSLLYAEYLFNPDNPLINNPRALFNLGYTAVIIYLFGFLYHSAIMKTYDELDASDRQKAMLLGEVHHRVKNNLNIIASIIGLQAGRLEARERDQLLKSKARIESIALVHEMLYRQNDFERIDFEAYVKQLSGLLLSMYSSGGNVSVKVDGGGIELPLETMVQLGIMTHEMLTNSMKHAFKYESGNVRITLERTHSGYRFVYDDDGRGSEQSDEMLKYRSLGVKLIRLTAKQLGGEVRLENAPGLKYTVEFAHE